MLQAYGTHRITTAGCSSKINDIPRNEGLEPEDGGTIVWDSLKLYLESKRFIPGQTLSVEKRNNKDQALILLVQAHSPFLRYGQIKFRKLPGECP
eukprot:1140451-Pelagomonas_calceolata.AAC.3